MRRIAKLCALLAAAGLALGLMACSSNGGSAAADTAGDDALQQAAPEPAAEPAPSGTPDAAASNAVVIYFSHAGENYVVGVVEEGNTAVVAKMIAEKTGASLFEIVPAVEYPQGYDECCDVAQEEQRDNARPAFVGDLEGFEGYDTVYLGYPIWWGDLPMVVYTFVEGHDWAGKTVRPFATHAGSGLSNTVSTLQGLCVGATVGEGLAIEGTTAQNDRAATDQAVTGWLGQ